MYAVLLPLGVAGVVVLWRRRVPISPLVGPAVAVTVTAAMVYGLTRYRVPADVGLCIGAGVAIDALVVRRWPLRPGDRATVVPRPARAGAEVTDSHATEVDPARLVLPSSVVPGVPPTAQDDRPGTRSPSSEADT
jgi:hypothetical protein